MKALQISFSGRCGRVEFLFLVIFNFILSFGIIAIANTFPLFLAIFPLILLLFFAVTFQRLHDIGHSGLWSVMWFVPGLHLIFLFYLLLRKGDGSSNQYGDSQNAKLEPKKRNEVQDTFAQMDAEIEREEHEKNLWLIITQLVQEGVSEESFPDELIRRYNLVDGRGSLFLSKRGRTWRVKVSSAEHPHIETDYEFSGI